MRWALPVPTGPTLLVGWIAVVATAVTDVIALAPAVRFAYHAPILHVSLETAASLVAALAAYLALGRFRHSGLLADLLLFASLLTMALANAVGASASSLPGSVAATPLIWLGAVVGTCGAAVYALSALLPTHRVSDGARGERLALIAVLALVSGLGLAANWLAGVLPVAVELGVDPGTSSRPQLVGHPSMLVLQLLGLAVFTIAAIGFTRRAQETGDDFLRWLGVAAVLGAAARANYMLYPSLYSDWVYTGDAFRLLFYVVILIAAARQIRAYWEAAAAAAVVEERRRLARDLHDGVAQELGYVLRSARRLDRADPLVAGIVGGVGRALDESRRAIDAMTEPLDEPLGAALERAARDAARREGASVKLDVAPGIEVSRDQREALARISAEAVANAGRHSGSTFVVLSCTGGERVQLRVADAGRGFDPELVTGRPAAGFGLTSMRERAAGIGAEFAVHSRPGAGTTVEVTL